MATKKTTKATKAKKTTKKAAKKKPAKKKPAKKPAAKKPSKAKAAPKETPKAKKPMAPPKPTEASKFLVFSDLHFSADTMDRAMRALRSICDLALEHGATVVFTGDFWDSRGSLSVRQLDVLLVELARWESLEVPAVFIPGNHDQVSRDGQIHALNIMQPFPNIQVATEPLYWNTPQGPIAFLPWREKADEQLALFENLKDSVEGDNKWTIFGHAEISGARTNFGYTAVGRVSLGLIESVSRACYLGHYHLRQRHGEHTWYMGNPFELSFRECNEPKGVALVSLDDPQPTWIELPGFPKHHVLAIDEDGNVPDDWRDQVARIDPQDSVRVQVHPAAIGSEAVEGLTQPIVASDIRVIPGKATPADDDPNMPPAFALSIDEGITAFAAKELDPVLREHLISVGKGFLAEVPEPVTVPPIAELRIAKLEVTDFCAIQGTVEIDFEANPDKLILIRGPIGIGKTSIADSLNWCLYGITSPRKANSATATFRGDEVINDFADSCSVIVTMQSADGIRFTVRRFKNKGSGAKAELNPITGELPLSGIADTDQEIQRLLGLDYGLWRACVSLGQGAVANFVTDADKARKTLLSAPFGLGVCTSALKTVKARMKEGEANINRQEMSKTALEAQVQTLAEVDLTAEAQNWAARQEVKKIEAMKQGKAAKEALAEVETQLAGRDTWVAAKTSHEKVADDLLKKLAAIPPTDGLDDKARAKGAAQAERASVQQSLTKATGLNASLRKAQAEHSDIPCPTCGKPLDTDKAELIRESDQECSNLQEELKTFDARIANLDNEVEVLRARERAERAGVEKQLQECREGQAKIDQALTVFDRLSGNAATIQRQLTDARNVWVSLDQEVNPFEAQQAVQAAKAKKTADDLATVLAHLVDLQTAQSSLAFWAEGFSSKGVPALVLKTVLFELETHANQFLAELTEGRIFIQLTMEGDALGIAIREQCKDGEVRERRYEQMSGGMRRCIELAFSPFALGAMIFERCGVNIPFLVIDEITLHLGKADKPKVADVLRALPKQHILVIDHDTDIQGEFDTVLELQHDSEGSKLVQV